MQGHKTSCVLCAQNCGLEVLVEAKRISKVKGDKDNPRSKGYVCRKGIYLVFHQHNADRLSSPRKQINGSFQRISLDQAIEEIADQLKSIVGTYGPRSLACMGGQGIIRV